MQNISSLISEIVSASDATENVFFGNVTDVDLKKMTCSVNPNNTTAEVSDIRLIAQSDDSDEVRQGMTLIPKIGSVVMVVMESDTEGFIGLYSKVERAEWMVTGNNQSGTITWSADGSENKVESDLKVAGVSKESALIKTSIEGTSQEIKSDVFSTKATFTADGYEQASVTKTGKTTVEFKDRVVIKNTISLKEILSDILTELSTLTVSTGVGPSGTPINAPNFQPDIKAKIDQLFKE